MSARANAKFIGLFVIVAIMLLIGGLFTFGSGNWFRQQYEIEMAFTGSVKGLSVGSAITFRGVQLGEVSAVDIQFDGPEKDVVIIATGSIYSRENSPMGIGSHVRDFLEQQVAKGLRGQLVSESLVTGRLQIQLEFFPERTGYSIKPSGDRLVIPTVPTDFEILGNTLKEFGETLQQIPFLRIAMQLEQAVTQANKLLASDELKNSVTQLSELLAHLNRLAETLDDNRSMLVQEYQDTAISLRTMSKNVSDTAKRGDAFVASAGQFVNKAGQALSGLEGVLEQSKNTLTAYEHLVLPGSELNVSLGRTLDSITLASEQVRQLAETLQRNPESILTGKQR
ncbi:MAG: MCE family protein [Hahellaceae bacterium]|nr:MCE family protein [Hahellaceae bacterium]